MTDLPTRILGVAIGPITPATWSILNAIESPFLSGETCTERHVLDFLWVHSPRYVNTARPWRTRKFWTLLPAVLSFACPWRKADEERRRVVLALAVVQIRELLMECFADAPGRKARQPQPVASVEAFLIHEFASTYQWDAEITRHFPLAQLLQLHRCIRVSRGEPLQDDGEDAILAAHLRKKNAARLAETAKPEEAPGLNSHG